MYDSFSFDGVVMITTADASSLENQPFPEILLEHYVSFLKPHQIRKFFVSHWSYSLGVLQILKCTLMI